MDYWIKALKDDPREIYRASQDAQVMSDYVLDRRRDKGPEREPAPATERDRKLRPLASTAQNPPEQQRLFPLEMEGPSR